MYLTPQLNSAPYHLILESSNGGASIYEVLHRITSIVEVIVDLILIIIEELGSLVIVDETGDTSGAAISGYVLDLICIGEASSKCIMHGTHGDVRHV